eukprot:1110127-Prorocentrum_minimum.AAC.4
MMTPCGKAHFGFRGALRKACGSNCSQRRFGRALHHGSAACGSPMKAAPEAAALRLSAGL